MAVTRRKLGWDGRDRTSECRNQNPVPCRLATSHQSARQTLARLTVGIKPFLHSAEGPNL